jgi:signal-transduction protein with cAMP-binding, CBS, and nucleotidyltransferase domain
MDELKQLLKNECRFEISDGLLDRFIGAMTEVRLRNKEVLIPYGRVDSNVYVLKSGIVRYVYFEGEEERTWAFAVPGTIMISFHSLYEHQPAFFQLESCGESVVGRVSKSDLYGLVADSHEFAQWFLDIQVSQLYLHELKVSIINGQTRERFRSLIENRPEIIARVPLKIIASYLGVTPNYLSNLKKSLYKHMK